MSVLLLLFSVFYEPYSLLSMCKHSTRLGKCSIFVLFFSGQWWHELGMGVLGEMRFLDIATKKY